MKLLLQLLTMTFLSLPAFASVQVFTQSEQMIGNYSKVQCGPGLTCAQNEGRALMTVGAGDGTSQLYGFRQLQSAVSQDLTVDDCGKTFTSDYVGPETYNLPLISSSTAGCRFTFIVGRDYESVGQFLKVDPNAANKILILTNSAGDSITADVLGESIVLEAIDPGWAPVGKEQGTWTDAN